MELVVHRNNGLSDKKVESGASKIGTCFEMTSFVKKKQGKLPHNDDRHHDCIVNIARVRA
jgi:hypothetical protein